MVAAAVAADPEGFRNSVLGPCAACGVEEAVQVRGAGRLGTLDLKKDRVRGALLSV